MKETGRSEGGSWWIWLLLGSLMLLGGFIALANPMAATITAEQLAGWVILATGVIQIVAVFLAGSWSMRLWSGIFAIAYLWLGISLLANPLHGVIALTAAVAVGFMVSGLGKLLLAFEVRSTPLFWPLILSAALSIMLALMVFFKFPQAVVLLLGMMLAFELVFSGATMLGFAFWLRALGRDRAT